MMHLKNPTYTKFPEVQTVHTIGSHVGQELKI